MAHVDARERKWSGNWRMEWVASTLHTTLEHGVSSITTADAHISAASSRLNWLLRRFKWTRPFRRKTKPGFCACAITFQTQSTHNIGASLELCVSQWQVANIGTSVSFSWRGEYGNKWHMFIKYCSRWNRARTHRPVLRISVVWITLTV